jgi:hypothetical protein
VSSKNSLVKSGDESGSATAEFVLLALPLFLPALLFFISISNSARSEMEASFLARQAVSAFTSGENDLLAHLRVHALLSEFQKNEMSEQLIGKEIEYSVRCSEFPCITRGGEVEITIQLMDSMNKTKSISSARSTVDKW